jgi:hypothetical protein
LPTADSFAESFWRNLSSTGRILRRVGPTGKTPYQILVLTAIYSCQCRLIRETCLDSSSLIDWLWIWWMDFVAPSLFE